jgi:cobalt-zinc-cadmium efflux system membrane fusion protein
MGGLTGIAVWGHDTDWTFDGERGPTESSSDGAGGLARVKVGALIPERSDVPSTLRREVTIELASAGAGTGAGIKTDEAEAEQGAITEALEAPGEVTFDTALITRIGPRAPGPVWAMMKKAGDPVAAGEVLALVDAVEAGKAKAEFQQTLVQLRLRQDGVADLRSAAKVVSAQSVREAEAALAESQTRLLAAAQALANLDLTADPADYQKLSIGAAAEKMRLLGVPPGTTGLDPKSATANLIPVRAPFSGVVLSTDGVVGELAEPGRPLFVIADPRRVWVTLHVRSSDVGRVAAGQTVRFRTDGSTEEFGGQVERIGRTADEATRTVPVRATLPNDAGRLRAWTLGQGRIILRQEEQAIRVPSESVQMFRGAPVVFVRGPETAKPDGPTIYRARPVWVGAKDAKHTEIRAGLEKGEVVATEGSGLLLHELARAIDEADAVR